MKHFSMMASCVLEGGVTQGRGQCQRAGRRGGSQQGAGSPRDPDSRVKEKKDSGVQLAVAVGQWLHSAQTHF